MFQQTQIVHQQNCQQFRMSINIQSSDEIKDEGYFVSFLNTLQISQQDFENLSLKFKSETMVDFKYFLEIFYGIIKQQKVQEGEDQQYLYMKQNLISLLIESLRMYLRKGGQISFEPSFDNFIKECSDNNLSEQAQLKLFQDSIVCEKLSDYIMNQFDNNKPEGNYNAKFFKQCWEDYAHYKQRMLDKIPFQRQDTTKFNKIYRWDTLYTKIIELILDSNQLSELNLHNRQKLQQSSFILQYGLVDIKDQIQQNQELHSQLIKQIEFHKQKLQELERIFNELKQEEQNKQMEQSNNHQLLIDESDKLELTPKISEQMIEQKKSLFNQEQIFIIPIKEFLYELKEWIEQMRQKQLQKLQENEQKTYLYMKDNMFRIFIESLCIYMNKGHSLNLGAIEKLIQNGDFLNQANLQALLFQDESICDKIYNYIRNQFIDNLPNVIQYVNLIKDVWEDISYAKLREFNQNFPYKPQKTNYHKIFSWDQVYSKIVLLLMTSASKEDNILSALSKQIELQNNISKQQGTYEINQMYLQNQEQSNKEQENKHNSYQYQSDQQMKEETDSQLFLLQPPSEQQDNQLDKQFNNFQQSVSPVQQQRYNKRKIKKILQQQILLKEINLENEQKQQNNLQLNDDPQEEKLKVYLSKIQENKRQEFLIEILTDLMYTDLQNQTQELDVDLLEFYNFIDDRKQKQQNFKCDINSLAKFYYTQAGKQYLLNFIDKKFQSLIICNEKDKKNLQTELNNLRITIKQKSKNLKKKEPYD